MMKKTTIIYLPGFGERFDEPRKLALNRWQSPSREVVFLPLNWDDRSEKLAHKIERVGDVIRAGKGKIVLVGESAGASVALVAFKTYGKQVSQVITICGKNQDADNVRRKYYRRRPAFREAMVRADKIVAKLTKAQKSRIEIFYSKYDFLVRPDDTLIEGVRAHQILTIGHFLAIAGFMTEYRQRIFAVIKRP